MTDHDMTIALNFIMEGWLHSNGDTRENVLRAIGLLHLCVDDWADVLNSQKDDNDE